MTVDEPTSEEVALGGAPAMSSSESSSIGRKAAPSDPGDGSSPSAAAAPAVGPPGPGSYAFDENTLGRSTSVFDSGVEFVPPAVAPMAPEPVPSATAPPERSLTSRERRRRVKLEARRVRRIIRHIELWSVLKVSVIFYFCLWLIFVLAGVLLWSFAESSGTLESIEELIESLFALDESEDFWSGGTIFRAYAIITLALSIAGITFNVLLAALYNLISDLTGGVRITVIEEESARFTPPKRRPRR